VAERWLISLFQNAAATKIAQQIPKSVNSVQILKRRVGYFDEELSTTRQKLSRMEVDGEKESEGHAEDGPA
jgi:hypothetical protein